MAPVSLDGIQAVVDDADVALQQPTDAGVWAPQELPAWTDPQPS